MKPILYIFSGLPGSGKTTIAKKAAKRLSAAYFRLDTIEHGLKEVCGLDVQGEGYRLAYRIVSDNLQVGNNCVVDCCNPWNLTRKEWEQVAAENGCPFVNIEIRCSDESEHRNRAENRESDIPGLKLPSWEEIRYRDYQEWQEEIIVIDTSGRSIEECVRKLIDAVGTAKTG